MMAVYIAVVLFFPDVLRGSNRSAGGRFSEVRPVGAATPAPVYSSIGAKVDEIIMVLDNLFVEHIDMDDFADKVYREVVSILKDPYTSYMDAEQFARFMEDTDGVYAGIGVLVTGCRDGTNRILVVTPFEGAPGAAAGILPGDAILKVNGQDVTGDRLTEAVNIIKGPPGTSVDLTIYRPSSEETFEKTIVRDLITVQTVNHRMLDDDIGYLRITQFDRVTTGQFIEAYEDLVSQGMKGIILDVRNNPGGLLDEVSRITNMLVPEGLIVYTEDKRGRQKPTMSNESHIDIPMLVLINGGSASASEILAGAVRDHGVGELVGTTTFGKGLVQNLYPMADGSAIKVTVAKYFTPNGNCIQDIGLIPDHEIEMDNELSVRIAQLTLDEDVQLRHAIEIMNGKLGN
jgi:carboxyl-terminal processing protease